MKQPLLSLGWIGCTFLALAPLSMAQNISSISSAPNSTAMYGKLPVVDSLAYCKQFVLLSIPYVCKSAKCGSVS